MEKNLSSLKIVNIIICILLLTVFVVFTRPKNVDASTSDDYPSIKLGYEFQKLELITTINTYKEESNKITYNIDYYLEEKKDTIAFFAKAFGYDYNDVIKDLQSKNEKEEIFLMTNIGFLKNENNELLNFENFEYGLIEYFYNLNKTKKLKKNNKYIPYEGNSSYVENLIIYYSNIYTNVDQTLMLSIGAAESGYYKVKYMLKKNNVYGGMTSNGLIRHDNIELGVLSYIRMMSKNYYSKGLTNKYTIGKVYCPVFENGIKKASNHWINLVTTAENKYQNYKTEININDIINKEELA